MPAMMIKRRYLALIRSGQKRSTIRRSTRLQPGERFTFTDCQSSIRVRCRNVRETPIALLTDADAKRDGLRDRDELLTALREHYPALKAHACVVVIDFELDENDSAQSDRATDPSGQLFPT